MDVSFQSEKKGLGICHLLFYLGALYLDSADIYFISCVIQLHVTWL